MAEEKAKKSTVKKTKAEERAELEAIKKSTSEILEQEAQEVIQAEEVQESKPEKNTAKAGKRSEKGIKEAVEKQQKIEKQKTSTSDKVEATEKPKPPVKPARSRLERRGKKYREAAKLIDASKHYTTKDAIELAIKTSPAKFDATVEVHVRLNVDPRQADQNLRDNLVLPAGTGKTVRVAVFADEDVAKEALNAGADIAGNEDFLKQLDKGIVDFDILIATPNVMAKLSKYARLLGPKGLMPNPKSGTVTNDVAKAIASAKAGRVEYRIDSTGIIHLGIGKASFGKDKIGQNVEAVFASIRQNKPSSIKGSYVRSITLTTTMGPSVKILPSELS